MAMADPDKTPRKASRGSSLFDTPLAYPRDRDELDLTTPDTPRQSSYTAGPSTPRIINRKPVRQLSIAESSIRPTSTIGRSATLASTRPHVRSPTSTSNLFSQATTSLSHLAGDVDTIAAQEDDARNPPPYSRPPSSPPQDTKRRHSVRTEPEADGLVQMIAGNRFEAVQKMIEAGVDIDEADDLGRTPVMYAANSRRAQICHMLLVSGCRLHLKDLDQNTALHYAAMQGDVEICRLLLEGGAQLDEYNREGKTPIQLAARAGHLETVDCLLNCWTALGGHSTALINGFLEAAKSGNVATARLFIDRGVKPKKIKDSWKAVAYAAISGSIPMLDLLVAHRCNLKDRSPMGWTALHQAAYCGAGAVMIQKLLDWKLPWKGQTKKDQETALHLSIRAGHQATSLQLIRHKDASVSVEDADSQQPIHHAARSGDLTLMAALLAKGAKLDTQNDFGWTPMALAAAYGHPLLIADLLVRGASTEEKLGHPDFRPSKKTNEAARKGYWAEIRWPHPGSRPLHLALEFGNDDVASMLLAHGCKPDEADSQGWRPLHNAAFHGRIALVDLLLQRGASPHSTTHEGNTPLSLGFREHGAMPGGQEKEQICEILHAAGFARRKSKLSRLSSLMSSASSRDAGERNRAWHLAELAEGLYAERGDGDEGSELALTPTSSNLGRGEGRRMAGMW